MREEEVCAFVQRSIGSVWALELLLLLWRGRDRTWRADELVRELRSSDTVVREALAQLTSAGLAQQTGEGWRYGGATSEPDQAVAELEKLYAAKPSMIVRLVLSTPSERLRVFSNAFKFKD